MADLTITAANVKAGDNASKADGTAGETITAGQVVYRKSADSKIYKASCDVSAAEANSVGVALNGASLDQPVEFATAGSIDLGATLTRGETYMVSTSDGGIAPVADRVSGNYATNLGIAIATDEFSLDILASGVTKA